MKTNPPAAFRLPVVPARFKPYLHLGTCSWKYDSWKGLVYDRDKPYRPNDYLADYARFFNSVEVDQWFWSLFPDAVRFPEARTVKAYAAAVPEDFVFSVKAPNALTLTHFYKKEKGKSGDLAGRENPYFLSGDLLARFLEALAPLGKKLGPVMFQFEYLNKQKMPSREAFYERFGDFIRAAPKGPAYAVEIRNPNFLVPDFFDFLRLHGLGFVYLDGYYMPGIGEVFAKNKPRTASFQVVRLHGGDRGEIEKETGEAWNRIVAPKPASIDAAVDIVAENARNRIATTLNINNHFEGSAPLTAGRFLERLAERA
ncbi:MAG: DUF72 domain-containing protein [Candidatus Aminicenantes bacterium]|nr:DUF72 domain-containing protein [Candidatus Aminicenantes bacterium]